MGIEARTSLRCGARQVAMPHNLRFREELVQVDEQIRDSLLLGICHGITWLASLIQPALVAYADRAAVVRPGMSTHLQQETMLRHRAVLAHIEMVAHIIEPTVSVVVPKLFNTIVLRAPRSRAVQHQIPHGVGIHHHLAVLHTGEQSALIAHHLLTDTQRKILCNHVAD